MENKTLPTAEEFFYSIIVQSSIDENGYYSICDIQEAMIEFAKLHVKEALKDTSEGQIKRDIYMMCEHGENMDWKSSILNSYPLDNIK